MKQTLKDTGRFVFKDGVMSLVATLTIIIYNARKTRIKYHTCKYRHFALFVLPRASEGDWTYFKWTKMIHAIKHRLVSVRI